MNQDQQLNQALRLTVNDLTAKITEESTTKNLLAIQLTESEQAKNNLAKENATLQARAEELEAENKQLKTDYEQKVKELEDKLEKTKSANHNLAQAYNGAVKRGNTK